MSKDVATTEENPFITMVEKIASHPEINAETVDRLLAAQERVLDREAKQAFYEAMNHVQAELPTVVRDAWNDQTRSKYARLETISRQIKPVYTKYGFSASFSEGKSDREGYIRVDGRLRHKSGHSEAYSLELPIDAVGIQGKANKTQVHGSGSTFTYGRRYLTCMMFDVAVGDDNDGNDDDAGLTEEQEANLTAMLDEISDADAASFWKKARVEPGAMDELRASKYQMYFTFLKGKASGA